MYECTAVIMKFTKLFVPDKCGILHNRSTVGHK